MNESIWGFADIVDDVEIPELVELFGSYVLVVKSLVIDEKVVIEYSKRMPYALAVEEVLRSPTNDGINVNRAKIVGGSGKWDMSGSAPFFNLLSGVNLED